MERFSFEKIYLETAEKKEFLTNGQIEVDDNFIELDIYSAEYTSEFVKLVGAGRVIKSIKFILNDEIKEFNDVKVYQSANKHFVTLEK